MEWLVVLNGSCRSSNVGTRFLTFGTPQETVTHLHGPVPIGHHTQPRRARVPAMRIEVISILVRLAAVENGAFKLEPAIRKSGREYPKADVSRVLQVVRERGRRIL